MNKTLKTVLTVIVVAAVLLGIVSLLKTEKAKAQPSDFRLEVSSTVGTSTRVYMTPGTATTTTSAILMADIDKVDLYTLFTASTTAAYLQWRYEYSLNQVDWYNDDSIVTPTTFAGLSNLVHASTTINHQWAPGNTTASTTGKVLTLPETTANFVRVVFSIPTGVSSSNGAIWYALALKRNAGN